MLIPLGPKYFWMTFTCLQFSHMTVDLKRRSKFQTQTRQYVHPLHQQKRLSINVLWKQQEAHVEVIRSTYYNMTILYR